MTTIAFKYRANVVVDGGSRDISSLLNDKLYAPTFNDLNDPFEFRYQDNISQELVALSKSGVRTKDVKERWREFREFINDLGVYSLSESEIPDNELMWAHYANSHKGFCIAYDVDLLKQSGDTVNDIELIKVKYADSPANIGLMDIRNYDIVKQKLLATKSKSWAYENETRLLYSHSGLKQYNPNALQTVYFGLFFEKSFQQQIIDGLKNRDVSFYKMVQKPNSYSLIPKFICKNERKLLYDISNVSFKVIAKRHYPKCENYHILYNGDICEESIKTFILGFREKYSQLDNSNIYLYDSEVVKDLIDIYPLVGDKLELVTKHFIAQSLFDAPYDVWMYPYK
jgi:hypothetical protein